MFIPNVQVKQSVLILLNIVVMFISFALTLYFIHQARIQGRSRVSAPLAANLYEYFFKKRVKFANLPGNCQIFSREDRSPTLPFKIQDPPCTRDVQQYQKDHEHDITRPSLRGGYWRGGGGVRWGLEDLIPNQRIPCQSAAHPGTIV